LAEEGIKSLTKRFNKIKETYYAIEVIFPFKEEFAPGNKIFTYYFNRGRKLKDDPEGGFTHVMGYVVITNGKIALVNFLHCDGKENAQ